VRLEWTSAYKLRSDLFFRSVGFTRKFWSGLFLYSAIFSPIIIGGERALAENSGTALSNDQDVMRLDARGGFAIPSPGFSAGVTALWTVLPSESFGLALDGALHQLDAEDAKMSTRALDVVWEHSIGFFEGFHALRIRAGAGAVRVHRTMDNRIALLRGKSADRVRWAPHISGSVALDFPIADLMWVRFGVWTERAILKDTPTQGGVFVGWVIGGQWLGIGD
jgi:hypothetical protein